MAKIRKAGYDAEQMLYEVADYFGDSKEGWQQLAVEIVKAMTDSQAKEVLSYIARNWEIDFLANISDAEDFSASTKKSQLSKEYRVNSDREIDIDIMAGELTVRVSDVQSGWSKNKQIDVMNLPWQIVGNINEILGENWDEIPQFVAIENALVEKYDEHWQEVNRQLHEQNGWKSTKKSIQKPINKTMSFEDNVNKMRKSNYDRTGNLNTIIKERR